MYRRKEWGLEDGQRLVFVHTRSGDGHLIKFNGEEYTPMVMTLTNAKRYENLGSSGEFVQFELGGKIPSWIWLNVGEIESFEFVPDELILD